MTAWMDRAACKDMPKDAFFIDGDRRNPRVRAAIDAAKAVCASCPVVSECKAASTGQWGLWGGLTEAERGLSLSHSPPTKHGTTAGHRQHYRRGEQPCEPCRLAHMERERVKREERNLARADSLRSMLGRAS